MARSVALISALVAVVGVVFAATVPFASAAQTKTLQFTTPVKQEVQHFVDTGKKGPSLGDYFTLHGPLHKQGGAIVGRVFAVCTVVQVKPIEFNCVGAFSLSGGQITFQGVFHGQNNQPPFTFTITGGTKAYQTAQGQITISTVKGIDHEVVHLIL